MALREPTEKELKVIRKALNYFGCKNPDFTIRINERKEVFALSPDLGRFVDSISFYSAGIKIGEVGRRLRLTLEGAYWIVRKNRKKVWVNERGEMLFLYGRDIFASSIIKTSEFGENEIVFVCNRNGDILGIGKSRFSSDRIAEIDANRVVVENLVDRGEYIRHKKLYNSF
ncbi:PUA domain-containing protein [Archaeoglobus neptunius]|uniref:PUA domain-containing protein n=1 Tax=Archaeoglobus neptunius TaxID=2798580 RepID=UPI00192685E1|nr:NIP7 N-terminal domain-related protein [Archaeoglobus neptunius]